MITEALIGTGALCALAGGGAVKSYNNLVALAQRCDQAAGDIDVQLRHRHDLIPSLVETVRGFASHERGIIDSLMNARAAAMRAATAEEQQEAEAVVSVKLNQALAAVETYPEVRGSQHFSDLRRELSDVENKIAASRRFLNLAVSEYNASLGQFPNNVIARKAGLRDRRFYDLGLDRVFAEEAPAFKF